MQRATLTLLLLLPTATAWTQVPVPGTFTARPGSGTYVYGAPILTPPEASFGSGLTGPVVVNHVPIVVATPESVPVEPSAIAQSQDITVAEAQQPASAAPRHVAFDYVVAPSSGIYGGVSSGVGDRSLGEIAESMRKGPPPTQRSFTNDDILRMNSISNGRFPMPSGAAPQPQTQPPPQQPQQQPPQRNRADTQPRSPFSPPTGESPVQVQVVSTQP